MCLTKDILYVCRTRELLNKTEVDPKWKNPKNLQFWRDRGSSFDTPFACTRILTIECLLHLLSLHRPPSPCVNCHLFSRHSLRPLRSQRREKRSMVPKMLCSFFGLRKIKSQSGFAVESKDALISSQLFAREF